MATMRLILILCLLLIPINAFGAILFECSEDEDDSTYSFQTFEVELTGGTSGTPATFANFVTADRAGTAVLLEAVATSLNETLDEQIRPVENLALTITFTIAAKTADADFLWIVGTDWDGNAQTEDIDITAGDGAYNSVNKYKTITSIDCDDTTGAGEGTACADGTLKVEQDRWGLIWDYGSGQYLVNTHFNVGDGTSTYFRSREEQITFAEAFKIEVEASATLTSGTKTTDYSGHQGSSWYWMNSGGTSYGYLQGLKGDGVYLLYNSRFASISSGSSLWKNPTFLLTNSSSEIVASTFHGFNLINPHTGASTLRNVFVYTCASGIRIYQSAGTFDRIYTYDGYGGYSLFVDGQTTTLRNSVANDKIHLGDFYTTDANIIDCSFPDTSGPGVASTSGVLEKYTINIHVQDKDGVAISGATVECANIAGGTSSPSGFSVATDGSGDITVQELAVKRYYYDGGATSTSYSPHNFTISASGYRTVEIKDVTITAATDWEIELDDGDTTLYDTILYDSTIY